ncbi:MAG: lysophospholipid acyltransferase family protein [Chloroflexi bacterium]|nr:lysophospholipid acyltransferase family protein [Chloroflexota bacterium]
MIVYWGLRLLAWVLGYVHDGIAYPVFRLIGVVLYWVVPGRRRMAEHNLRHVLGPDATPAQVRACGIEASQTLALNYYELFHMPAYSREAIRARMTINGVERIAEALERKRGVILVTLHLGNVETLIQVPSLYPYMRFMMLVERMHNPGVLRMMSELRASQGVDIVNTDELMKLVRRLKENGVVALAADRDVTGSGAVLDFFGRPARLPDGAVRLAARTGAALILAYGWRDHAGGFRVEVEPAMALVSTRDADADARENMRRLAARLEYVIRARPGQWMAFHSTWI